MSKARGKWSEESERWFAEQLAGSPEIGPSSSKALGELLAQIRVPDRNNVRRGEVRPA